jgi:iron complex transport system ATP-binding protein
MLSCRNLSLIRGTHQLLSGIECRLPRHTITAIIGKNGAGKSTLLRCLAGLEASVHGDISVAGSSYAALSRQQRAELVAWCPELLSCGEGFTLREVIMLGRYPWHRGFPGSKDHRVVDELLAVFSLQEKAKRGLSTLSSGELRKTMIARTLAQETPLVLLDEPCANLDIGASVQLLRYLQQLAAGGRTIVLCMHDLLLTKKCADRVILLEEGKQRAMGTVAEVFSSGEIERTLGISAEDARLFL